MDVMRILRKEEKKLLTVFGSVETKLNQVRAALTALSANHKKSYRVKVRHAWLPSRGLLYHQYHHKLLPWV